MKVAAPGNKKNKIVFAHRLRNAFIAAFIILIVSAAYIVYNQSSVSASSVYGLYFTDNGDNTVSVSVYWDDEGGGSQVFWANSATANGALLDWQNSGFAFNGLNSGNALAVYSTAVKYRNYYFKITKNGEEVVLKAFPVDMPNAGMPERLANDNAHTVFTNSTYMCAKCHVTHSGLKEKLLIQATYYDLCMLCHGTANIQSKYDVKSGLVLTGGGWKPSLGGPIGSGFTSRHDVDDNSSVDTTVYGSAPGKILTFTCISCHLPHGTTRDVNYRLLRKTVYPSNDKFTSTTVSYTAYSIVSDPAVGEELYMVSGNSEFCTACHFDYDDGSSDYPGTTYGATGYYRHPVTVGNRVYSVYSTLPARNWYPEAGDSLPLQTNVTGESIGSDKRTAVVCSTCHYAHGTPKPFNVSYPQGTGQVFAEVYNQKMLRLDDYGVCQSCHQK